MAMIKGVTHAHLGTIWYHSEPSDIPYSPNQFLGWDFFWSFLQQDSSNLIIIFSANGIKLWSCILSVLYQTMGMESQNQKGFHMSQLSGSNNCPKPIKAH